MRKIGAVFFVFIFILFGCSNEEKETTVTDNLTFEEQIHYVMAENNLSNIEVIDYDVIQNFVYIIFKHQSEHSNTHYPDLVILKMVDGELEWKAGPDDRTLSIAAEKVDATIFERENGPSVTILLPNNNSEDMKGIKVLGTFAKEVSYLYEATDDFVRENTYWISYTNKVPSQWEDFEFIMQ